MRGPGRLGQLGDTFIDAGLSCVCDLSFPRCISRVGEVHQAKADRDCDQQYGIGLEAKQTNNRRHDSDDEEEKIEDSRHHAA